MKTNICKRSVGVNYQSDGTATVNIWAPMATSVELKLTDGVQLPLQKKDLGYWHLTTADIKPGMEYGLVLDGKEPLADPASIFQPDGVHGLSSVIYLESFEWSDGEWHNIDINDFIIYGGPFLVPHCPACPIVAGVGRMGHTGQ